jgi:hypothetical protein
VLRADSQYGISLVPAAGYTHLTMLEFSQPSYEELRTFDTAPFLTNFTNCLVSAEGQWGLAPRPPTGTYLFLGATFRFQVEPQFGIQSTQTNTLVVTWSTPVSTDTFGLEQSANPLSGVWTPVTNALNVIGEHREVVLPPPQTSAFYRLALQ